MQTHRFGKKIKLPSTMAIKHQLRKLMFEDLVKEAGEAEAVARAEASAADQADDQTTNPRARSVAAAGVA